MLEGILGNGKKVQCLTREQVQRIYKLSHNHKLPQSQDTMMLIIGINTGINRDELVGISKIDVNLSAGTIYIRSEKKSRMVYITPAACVQLKPYLAKHNGSPDNLVNHTPEEFNRVYAEWSAATGVQVSWQTIRHTYAELAAQDGLPVKLVAHNIGVEEKSLSQHFDLTPGKIATILKDKVIA